VKKPATAGEAVADVKQRFRALFDKVNESGRERVNERDVERLRDMFGEHKDMALWRTVPGPGQAAIDYLLQQRMAGAAMSEAWRERVKEMKADLGYEEATGAERMLISHAVLCWLQLGLIELKYSHVLSEGVTLAQGRMWDHRVTLAQRRFTRALTELARLRALTAAARFATARAEAAEAESAARRGPRALRA
jgi:hypothetical protein